MNCSTRESDLRTAGAPGPLSFAVSGIMSQPGPSGMDYFTGLLANVLTSAVFFSLFLVLFVGTSGLWITANLITDIEQLTLREVSATVIVGLGVISTSWEEL